MMADNNLCYLSATELGEKIAAGEISSVDATEAYLERIARLDGNYASYITVTAERARDDARRADAEIAAGNRRGPLHGVPVAVKDQFDTAGIPTTNGSTILAENIPDTDATIMTRLKEAGTVLLGKLNMSEYASGDAFRHPYGQAAQSVGHQPEPWYLQQWIGRGDRGVPVRDLAGRGHRREYSRAGGILRVGWHPPDIGAGEPARCVRSQLVDGYRRADFTDGGGLRQHAGGHRGA